MKKGLKLIFLVYLFILLIELIKKSSLFLAPNTKAFLIQNLSPIKAICLGWFTTSIAQSSGATGSIVATFVGNNLLGLSTAVYILIGISLGTTITALIISLITVAQKRRDFRHGFEIALCYSLYVAMLSVVVFILEFFFKFFSKTSMFLASILGPKISLLKIPNIVGVMTEPIINLIFINGNYLTFLILSFIALIFTIKYMGKAVIDVVGGEDEAKKVINKYFQSKYTSFLIGFVLTLIIFSASITISLLVPLAVSRLINLKKAIPFILGARLGTFSDIFLASILIGNAPAIATALSFFLFAVVGALIFLPNTEFLFRITKYTSKKLIHISRKKALFVLFAFILIPLLILLIL